MHRLPLIFKLPLKVFLSLLLISMTLVGVFHRFVAVEEFDRRLVSRIDGSYLEDRRFHGIVYSLYSDYWPKHLEFFWNGQHVFQEVLWYPKGRLMALRPYKNGKAHGSWKMWYEDGNVKSLRHYVDGTIDGEYWGWHPNGQVSDFNLYDRGKERTHKSWIADGTPFYNYVYQEEKKVGMLGGDFCKPLAKIVGPASQ